MLLADNRYRLRFVRTLKYFEGVFHLRAEPIVVTSQDIVSFAILYK